MRWIKLGNIFCPSNRFPWMQSHAANPVADNLGDDLFRIYFSSRDENNRSSIGYIVIDINEPTKLLQVAPDPVATPGEIGTFDDSGASMGCITTDGDRKLLYYLGWNLGITVPWRNSIGLLMSDDGNHFERFSKAPVMDRNHRDPYSISYPFVMKEDGRWRMWYGSNLKWGSRQEDMDHLLKYAESEDGIHWNPTGEISVNFKCAEEYAMSKPSVIKDGDIYKMWYSYRGKSYRIGYAESEDGIHFERMDELAGIDVSSSGWDSESVEYPHVFDHKGQRFLAYNGNRYGLTGIGLAVLED
jgi:predicted GH43/DUF377 family glycosyl hydrolase